MAIDQATLSGLAWTEDLCRDTRWSTTFSIAKAAESRAGKLRAFGSHLTGVIRARNPDLVVYEKPNVNPRLAHHVAAYLFGMALVIEMICEAEQVAYQPINAQTIKSHALGEGRDRKAWMRQAERLLVHQGLVQTVIKSRVQKTAMMLAAQNRGWTVRTDDEADVLWLLDLACEWIREGKLR